MDTLSRLLQDLDLQAEVFFSGGLCGLQSFSENEEAGHLHLLRSGAMTLFTDQGHKMHIDQPSVLFLPSGSRHRIQVEEGSEAQLVCATVLFRGQQKSQLMVQLPKFICIAIEDDAAVLEIARWIFAEAFSEHPGREMMINRLCDIFMVKLLRFVLVQGTVKLALLTASSHSALAPLMKELQQRPEQDWNLDTMASYVAMSRSKFATLFKETVGQAPMEYVTDLRMAMAQGLLKNNKPVGLVAHEVGYEDASSLTRVFKKRFGLTPRQWLKKYLSS